MPDGMSPLTPGGAPPPPSSATALLAAFRAGHLSPVEVVETLARRAAEQDPTLNALTTANFDAAAHQAGEAQRRWSRGTARPLEGVPVLVKDLIDTEGLRTTYGSAMFADHVPAADAEAVAVLRRAGAIVLGKTATHEFAWGVTTDNPHFGPTRNPWDPSRTPGGSSGGSAAALAAGYAPLALGTDTAGSVRLPSAFCGLTGLRPTFGAVPVTGVRPLAPSADVVGPMARTVEDLRLLWTVVGPASPPNTTTVRVGLLLDDPTTQAARVCTTIADLLANAGLPVVELDAGALPAANPLLGTTILAEGRRGHRRDGLWPDRASEYGADVRERLELADAADPADYLDAQEGRAYVRSTWAEVLSRVDVVLSPAVPIAPPPIDAIPAGLRAIILPGIAAQSLAGLPALVVRGGFDPAGLPVGVQLTAAPWREELLLDTGELVQRLTGPVQDRWPELVNTTEKESPNVVPQR
ncbi:amidase [Amycolatopsis sp. NPDC047767]|uniref:amidase n=1 Tax=Amycolatopsis sp. NPDC047767 TaxID=3156765 RepID=UPI0034558180